MDDAKNLITEIETYCRRAGVAESTFGRQVVNDGKFVRRIREGKRVTSATIDKIRAFIAANSDEGDTAAPAAASGNGAGHHHAPTVPALAKPPAAGEGADTDSTGRTFRFYDPRAGKAELLAARAPLLERERTEATVFVAAVAAVPRPR